MPKVSVVSSFYNRGNYVQESIGSLICQTLKDIEIIVINDGSTDNTKGELEKIGDDRLLTLNQENVGFVKSMNRGIGIAKSNYIAVHGSGDLSFEHRLDLQAKYLDENPEVGIVGCRSMVNGRPFGTSTKDIIRGPLYERILNGSNPFSHGDVMFRKSLFEQVGGYREFFTFAQDKDLWIRMGRFCEYACLPEVLCERRFLIGGVSRVPEKLYMQMKLSRFATQCALTYDENQKDWVDQYGAAALILMHTDPTLSIALLREGLRWVWNDRVEGGQYLLRSALKENKSLATLLGVAAGQVSSIVPIRAIVRRFSRCLSAN